MDFLTVTVNHYYWKPVQALFRSLELEQYLAAHIAFENPLLDLGCNDGTFSQMLQDLEIVETVDAHLDHSLNVLQKIPAGKRCRALQADARELPFKKDVFATVLANGLFSSIPTQEESDIDAVLAAIETALASRGLLVLTVPSPHFNEYLLAPKLFRVLGCHEAAHEFLKKNDLRMAHYQVYGEQKWIHKLNEKGFGVEAVRRYFNEYQAFWYSILLLPIFKVFSILRLIDNKSIINISKSMLRYFLHAISCKERETLSCTNVDSSGYALILARKNHDGLSRRS